MHWSELSQITFGEPLMFLLLILLVPLIIKDRFRRRRPLISFSSTRGLHKQKPSLRMAARHLIPWLRILALALLIVAAARPQVGNSQTERKSEGLDIMLAIDTSGSMRAMDLRLNGTRYDRLTVVKNVILDFIKKRTDDRIGMVVFGTESFTQAPLTLDHEVLTNFLGQLEIEMAGPNTAIGDAIATAARRLKDLNSKSKIIILLTDGENTAGTVSPIDAAKAAATLGIKIYTIGVGTNGEAPFPVQGFFGRTMRQMQVKIDTKMLKDIAELTGAQSFLAADTEALRNVYHKIDQLEKTEVEVIEYMNYQEAGSVFLWPSLVMLFGSLLLSLTKLRTLP